MILRVTLSADYVLLALGVVCMSVYSINVIRCSLVFIRGSHDQLTIGVSMCTHVHVCMHVCGEWDTVCSCVCVCACMHVKMVVLCCCKMCCGSVHLFCYGKVVFSYCYYPSVSRVMCPVEHIGAHVYMFLLQILALLPV